MPAGLVVARAMLHLWEEPVLSGKNGAGCIFFSGCNLGCVFCQNGRISHENFGKVITPAHLREIMEGLVSQGAHCIDLVTPTHFTPWVLEALEKPLGIPVVWNSGGYERVETLRTLEGKVQIYLPDLKYAMERPRASFPPRRTTLKLPPRPSTRWCVRSGRIRLGTTA